MLARCDLIILRTASARGASREVLYLEEEVSWLPPCRHKQKERIRTTTLLLPPKRGVEGGLLKAAARKVKEENFMLV
jgi:hypothetical protein